MPLNSNVNSGKWVTNDPVLQRALARQLSHTSWSWQERATGVTVRDTGWPGHSCGFQQCGNQPDRFAGQAGPGPPPISWLLVQALNVAGDRPDFPVGHA